MRYLLLIILFVSTLFSATLEHITINHQPFTIVKEKYNAYGNSGEVFKFYQGDENKTSRFIRPFIHYDKTGDCSAKSMIEGVYEIKGEEIYFYTLWSRKGQPPLSLYGARVEQYKVLKSGTFQLLTSKIYLEKGLKGEDETSGMNYLFQSPKNKKEKTQLHKYIAEVEEEYRSTFVMGEESKKLIEEVKKALAEEMKPLWRAVKH